MKCLGVKFEKQAESQPHEGGGLRLPCTNGRSARRPAPLCASRRSCKGFLIWLFKYWFSWLLLYMAFGRIWAHGKYSYGTCRWFAYNFRNFEKWPKLKKCKQSFQQPDLGLRWNFTPRFSRPDKTSPPPSGRFLNFTLRVQLWHAEYMKPISNIVY